MNVPDQEAMEFKIDEKTILENLTPSEFTQKFYEEKSCSLTGEEQNSTIEILKFGFGIIVWGVVIIFFRSGQ